MKHRNFTGLAWPDLTWSGLVWTGLVWFGLVWTGLVWSGLVWSGLVWSGLVWSLLVWTGLVWSGLVWTGLDSNTTLQSRAATYLTIASRYSRHKLQVLFFNIFYTYKLRRTMPLSSSKFIM